MALTVRLTRAERVVCLLRTLTDARQAYGSGESSRVKIDTGPMLSLPSEYRDGSYAELERCLALLRAEAPSEYWHVSERYLRCDRRRQKVNREGADKWIIGRHAVVVTIGKGEVTTKKRPGHPTTTPRSSPSGSPSTAHRPPQRLP